MSRQRLKPQLNGGRERERARELSPFNVGCLYAQFVFAFRSSNTRKDLVFSDTPRGIFLL